jgi:hypothetical protein
VDEDVPDLDGEPAGTTADGDYDDWDSEGYFFVRNKNDPLELHTKQVQKIFGAYSIHVQPPQPFPSTPLPSHNASSPCADRLVDACVTRASPAHIQLLRELNEVVIFLEPSFLQDEMAFALGILKYVVIPSVHQEHDDAHTLH